MLEVDTVVDDSKEYARAVIALRQSCRPGIVGIGENVVDIGFRARGISEWAHQWRHVDAAHIGNGSHLFNLVDGDEGGYQAFDKLVLHLHAQGFKVGSVVNILESHEAGNIHLSVDGVG